MMAYNYDISKGKYPDEKGYHEWTGFELKIISNYYNLFLWHQ